MLVIMTPDFEQMWRDLAPVGRSSRSGGYFRQPFESAEREAVAWFLEQCRLRGLEVERDRFGNLAAWWRPGVSRLAGSHLDHRGRLAGSHLDHRGVLTGSHLDSVLDGGAYDGPLGVV